MDNELSRPWVKEVEPDAIVHSNGQKVTVGQKVLKEDFMDSGLIRRLTEFAWEHDFCLGFNIGRKGCYVHDEIIRDRERRYLRSRIESLSLWKTCFPIPSMPWRFSDGTRRRPSGLPGWWRNIFRAEMPAVFQKRRGGCDLPERFQGRWDRTLLDYYGMEEQDVVAFGDSMNDLEMIREAGIGVAMEMQWKR